MILALMLPAQMAWAQDIIPAGPSLAIPDNMENIKELATQFYNRCHSKPDATLPPQGQEEYCVCLSAQMYRKSLTTEERLYLATGEGVPMDYRRSISEVYGQCLGIPGRAATYNMCAMSYDAYQMVKSDDDLDLMCRCVINELSYFWDTVVPAFLELEMSRKRDVNDPLDYIINGREFPGQYAEVRSKCVSEYGRRD